MSLEDFFAQSHTISDLVLSAPERISVMRLLICIVQRALNGPEDRDDWEDCLDDIPGAAMEYLQKWRSAFNLIGEDGAFLQVQNVQPEKADSWKELNTISLSSAKGNNPTLFDNAAGSVRLNSLAQIAIDLITFQNFAPCGTIGVVKWDGKQTPSNAQTSPCAIKSAIHLFVTGDTILETIWLNLCTREEVQPFRGGWGVPVWELMPKGCDDENAVKNTTTTYLGRLVPVSRVVKLSADARRCLVASAVSYPTFSDKSELLYFESSMTMVMSKDDKRTVIGASLDKAMWRNLPALLHRFTKDGKTFSRLDEDDLPNHYGVWVGAVVYDQAKLLGIMEDYFEHLGKGDVGVSADKVQAILMKMADSGWLALNDALKAYYVILNNPINKSHNVNDAASKNYWGKLISYKQLYLRTLSSAAEDVEKYEALRNSWISAICKTAGETFELMAPHDGVRELSAWAKARQLLATKHRLNKLS